MSFLVLRRFLSSGAEKRPNPFTSTTGIDLGAMRVQSTTLSDIFAGDDASLNSNDLPLTQMNGYTPHGFKVNGVRCDGAMLLLPRTFVRWHVASLLDVSLASLSLATIYAPRISLLLIGTGDVFRPPTPALHALTRQLKQQHGIQVEFMRSVSAGSTFNFLNQEGRDCAAALLPISHR